MATAAQKVFATAELVEMILLKVDMQTLLVSCQRVDRTFKNTIDGSRELQKALWFLPDPDFQLDKLELTRTSNDEKKRIFWTPTTTRCDPRNPLIVKFGERIGLENFDFMFREHSHAGCFRIRAPEWTPIFIDASFADHVAASSYKDNSWGKMILFQGLEVEPLVDSEDEFDSEDEVGLKKASESEDESESGDETTFPV